MSAVLQIELNELNFDFVRRYIERGRLPAFSELISKCGVTETISEDRYEWLEPWIQWVTAHTGLGFEEHRVFRLGDITERPDLRQIWEILEDKGQRVAAMSPMNARNAVSDETLFVPDPWTKTPVSGPKLIKQVYDALSQAVNDNASQRMTLRSALHLVKGVLACCRMDEIADLSRLALTSRGAGWRKAIFLDVFLAALYLETWETRRPQFSTLFLNAGAHIQHHYMFSSGVYEGPHSNPEWYLPKGYDPLLEVYEAYDRILARIMKRASGQRLIIATGLHQDPEPEPVYYWRPVRHESLLRRMGVTFEWVQPRMSRDFLVGFPTEAASLVAEKQLDSITLHGKRVFALDQRGKEIFVELVYPDALPDGSYLESSAGGIDTIDLSKETAFVALKNGRHNGIGYLIDTQNPVSGESRMLLKNLIGLVA